jgi:hypothetical protein
VTLCPRAVNFSFNAPYVIATPPPTETNGGYTGVIKRTFNLRLFITGLTSSIMMGVLVEGGAEVEREEEILDFFFAMVCEGRRELFF